MDMKFFFFANGQKVAIANTERNLRMYKVHPAIEKSFAHWSCQPVLTEVAIHCMDVTIGISKEDIRFMLELVVSTAFQNLQMLSFDELIQPWRNWYLSRQLICRHVQPDKI